MVEHKPVSPNVDILQPKYDYTDQSAQTTDQLVLTDAPKMFSLFVLFKW